MKKEKAKPEEAKKPKFKLSRFVLAHTLAISGGLLAIFLLIGAGVLFAENQYKQKFFPGVKIAGVAVGGLTYTQALDKIEPQLKSLKTDGLLFVSGDTVISVPASLTPTDPGASEISIFSVDPDATVAQAYALGRRNSVLDQLGEQILLALQGVDVPIVYTLDADALTNQLTAAFSSLEQPATNADLSFNANTKTWSVIPAAVGWVFEYSDIVAEVRSRFEEVSTAEIDLTLESKKPIVSDTMAEAQIPEVEELFKLGPLQVQAGEHSFEIGTEEFARWLSPGVEGVSLNAEQVSASLAERAKTLDQAAIQGRFQFVNGKAEQSVANQSGRVIDIPGSIETLTQQIIQEKKSAVSINVIDQEPQFTPDNIEALGIKDLLGTGHSTMAGSPYNRQLNIKRGADLLNGLLIAPDEEFSVIEHLKPFTLDNGYYSELVIKGNKTTPEIGGGLCQIGTTTFRAAMNTGLPILQRQNHSYAVSYYFDDANHLPGTDATIYDPYPDLKFKNDTGHWILLTTTIEGNDLYFKFYGTSDGRHGYFNPPQISGWVAPPPTKEVPDASLAPGTQKCTEHAHPGTTANFDYIVEYADGSKHEETFTSIYKPWQAVCLVGPTATPEPEPEVIAPTTTPDTNTNTNSNTNSDIKKKKK